MKQLPEQFTKSYDAASVEPVLYSMWEKSGYFNPNNLPGDRKESYTIILPPPNVTGTLHTGHAIMLAIQDTLARFKRMEGYRTLWLPGTDHAAIATQSVVEKKIQKEEGKSRHDLGREEMMKRINAFALESQNTILEQFRSMGASLDWSRLAFTLDDSRTLAVRTMFKKMYDDGLIYRGHRIVNWDVKGQTTISDDELVYVEEKSKFYYFKYGPFTIGTARPETKFGDKYVVMHPKDTRYTDYIHGQKLTVEWINGPIEATIIKDESVDPEFGTGVMTITPWHSVVDFELAQKHGLSYEQIIDKYGKLLPIAQEFAGMKIKDAREKIVEKLQAKGLVEKIEDYTHNIATAERTGGVIEPQIMEQWFIGVNKPFQHFGVETTLKNLMRKAVENKETTVIPDRFEKVYFHWIENLRDWCISRQIWYGHRIPVWTCLYCKKTRVDATVKSKWFFVRHGETDYNVKKINAGVTDTPLNETGREQARVAAERLSSENISVVFSSGLSRAHETAKIISDKIGVNEIIIDNRLQERNMGKAEGLSYAETKERYPDMYTYSGKSGESESYEEAESRIWEAVSEHLEKHSHKNILIVSHGAVLRSLIRRIKNVDPENIITEIPSFGNASPVSVDILDTPCEECGHHFFEQDPDTLDTWFSSGLWTFSTLGWPKETDDMKTFHPTSLLETGQDILFFWVARMILFSMYALNEPPFKHVYLHGLVRDGKGQKMSKSLGNVLDPRDLTKKYGTDALRMALLVGNGPGNDLKLVEDKVKAYKNFANKIWNATRFVLEKTTDHEKDSLLIEEDQTVYDAWKEKRKDITNDIEEYRLHLASEKLYDYFWHIFCDEIIETRKVRILNNDGKESAQTLLLLLLREQIITLHPFMPFITEEIWNYIKKENDTMLMITKWRE